MQEDGTPPPDSVVIERVCNGRPRPEGYTDSKGRFSFQLGQNSTMMADASYDTAGPGLGMPGGGMSRGGTGGGGMGGGMAGMNRSSMGERDLTGCELRAVLPGYRSEVINLANHRSMDDPNVGTIILHRMGNVEGTTISATSLQAPKDAKKAFDKGKDALKKGKSEDAEKNFQKAVEIYPKYAVAWYELGQLQQNAKNFEEARKSYAQALAADGKYVSPYLQLSLIAAQEKKWEEVVDATNRAVKLDAFDFPQAYFYNSVANYNLRRMDAAEKSAREAQKLDTEHRYPQVNHLLGVILAEKRDYSGAADQMRSYLKFAPGAQDASSVRTQLTELEKLATPTAKAAPQQ
jgi:tetratricopeptide (TPR) repeat protein